MGFIVLQSISKNHGVGYMSYKNVVFPWYFFVVFMVYGGNVFVLGNNVCSVY